MKPYELIEHTADFGIRVKGEDLRTLFENIALAMFDCLAEKTKPSGKQTKAIISQEAEDTEELLINWLNELLSLSSSRGLIFTGFKFLELEMDKLKAEVIGEPIEDYKVNTEIKAATYHQLKVERAGSGWQAEVIFDV